MEFLVELFLEIIIEGTVEFGTSRKVPLPFRILLLLILGLVYGVLIGVLAMIAIECWKSGEIANSIFVSAIDLALIVLVVYMVRKKYKENRDRS